MSNRPSIEEPFNYSGARKVERIMRVVVKQWQCKNCGNLFEKKQGANSCCMAVKRTNNKAKLKEVITDAI